MTSNQLRKRHIQTFSKLTLSERLFWSFTQGQFFSRFSDARARGIRKKLRQGTKRYFGKLAGVLPTKGRLSKTLLEERARDRR